MLNECGKFVSVWCKIGVLWSSKNHPKSPVIPLSRQYVNNWWELDLSKEVLWLSVGQKVAKLQPVKFGGWSYDLGLEPGSPAVWFDSGRSAEYFSNLQLWQVVTLQPFGLKRPTVPLLKDLTLVINKSSKKELVFLTELKREFQKKNLL